MNFSKMLPLLLFIASCHIEASEAPHKEALVSLQSAQTKTISPTRRALAVIGLMAVVVIAGATVNQAIHDGRAAIDGMVVGATMGVATGLGIIVFVSFLEKVLYKLSTNDLRSARK